MSEEYNIFLLWHKVRDRADEVQNLVSQKFEIVRTYEIEWSKKCFAHNLSRFYGKRLPSAKNKQKMCGQGSFLVYLVRDETPKMIESGVNQNMTDMKYKLRHVLGGNYIHASDNQKEAEENLYFLLGKSLRRILAEPQPKKLKLLKQDVIGTPTWLDEDRVRKALKRVPEAVWDRENNVITCADVPFACRILNARKVIWPWCRDKYKISIRGRDKIFTLKSA